MIFLIIVGFEYLKIRISKNHLSMVLLFLFLGDLKNHLGRNLRNPKRGNYEMGARVKICD